MGGLVQALNPSTLGGRGRQFEVSVVYIVSSRLDYVVNIGYLKKKNTKKVISLFLVPVKNMIIY